MRNLATLPLFWYIPDENSAWYDEINQIRKEFDEKFNKKSDFHEKDNKKQPSVLKVSNTKEIVRKTNTDNKKEPSVMEVSKTKQVAKKTNTEYKKMTKPTKRKEITYDNPRKYKG